MNRILMIFCFLFSHLALAQGTCEDSCGGPSPDGCWCDEACLTSGDCCPDFTEQCDLPSALKPSTDTCEGSCGGMAPAGCWCDEQCSLYGDCCDDIAETCPTKEPDGDGDGVPDSQDRCPDTDLSGDMSPVIGPEGCPVLIVSSACPLDERPPELGMVDLRAMATFEQPREGGPAILALRSHVMFDATDDCPVIQSRLTVSMRTHILGGEISPWSDWATCIGDDSTVGPCLMRGDQVGLEGVFITHAQDHGVSLFPMMYQVDVKAELRVSDANGNATIQQFALTVPLGELGQIVHDARTGETLAAGPTALPEDACPEDTIPPELLSLEEIRPPSTHVYRTQDQPVPDDEVVVSRVLQNLAWSFRVREVSPCDGAPPEIVGTAFGSLTTGSVTPLDCRVLKFRQVEQHEWTGELHCEGTSFDAVTSTTEWWHTAHVTVQDRALNTTRTGTMEAIQPLW